MLYIEIVCCLLFLFATTQIAALRSKGELRDDGSAWMGPWFPYNPKNHTASAKPPSSMSNEPHRQLNSDCDDGVHSIGADFDPEDKRHSYKYLCLYNSTERQQFMPNVNTEAIQTFHFISPAYVPPAKCLNESIHYEHDVPSYGSYRPIPPKYGEYLYLPPERWVHSLMEGAIVMLYHPCAYSGQVKALNDIVKSCLYRHIITPSQHLSPQRPLAVLAWGKLLELSVVDDKMVVNFIREHAKHGPLPYVSGDREFEYRAALVSESHFITDANDTELCGYKES